MEARQIVNLLEFPLVNWAIYLAIFCVLVFSLFKYKKGQKEYAFVAFGFLLFLFCRIIQNLIFMYRVRPQTFLGIILNILMLLLVIAGSILVFYFPGQYKKDKLK